MALSFGVAGYQIGRLCMLIELLERHMLCR